ncbi:MAG: hypothetical protein KC486_18175 [Myxococcales bacterium]|nr:hypothetical protein [Myxococcales bacterium]
MKIELDRFLATTAFLAATAVGVGCGKKDDEKKEEAKAEAKADEAKPDENKEEAKPEEAKPEEEAKPAEEEKPADEAAEGGGGAAEPAPTEETPSW